LTTIIQQWKKHNFRIKRSINSYHPNQLISRKTLDSVIAEEYSGRIPLPG